MKHLVFSIVLLATIGCNNVKKTQETQEKENATTSQVKVKIPQLTLKQANKLAALPINCINTEFPNMLSQTLNTREDIKTPKELHPAFYGCFDWHSSVHGHWSLVALLRKFPNLDNANILKKQLLTNISKEHIQTEIDYFKKDYNKQFERTYGWAWLLKLAEEIHLWDDPVAKKLNKNLKPLTDLIVDKYIDFLPKLYYPIRVGEHGNTAFGLTFAWDYAKTTSNTVLSDIIEKRAKDFFLKDADCPLSWEPSGSDFLSPCLEEAELMKRILTKKDFKHWLNNFLPQLKNTNFKLAPGIVSDRTDGKLVHLDGLNFSRAWALSIISQEIPEYKHLNTIAYEHINASLPNLVGDDYEGGHWLGSFAIYSLNTLNKAN